MTVAARPAASVWFTDKLYRDLMYGAALIVIFGFWLATAPDLQPFLRWAFVVLVVWGVCGVLPFPIAAFMRWQDIHRPGWLMSEADRDIEQARAVAACKTRPDLQVDKDRDASLAEMQTIWPTLYRWPGLPAWIMRRPTVPPDHRRGTP